MYTATSNEHHAVKDEHPHRRGVPSCASIDNTPIARDFESRQWEIAYGFDHRCRRVSVPLDELTVVMARAEDVDVEREVTGASTGQYTKPSLYLTADFDSDRTLMSGDRRISLRRGDLLLTDRPLRHAGCPPGRCTVVELRMPLDWADRWLKASDEISDTRIPGDQGWGRAISAYVSQLVSDRIVRSRVPQSLLVRNLGMMLSLAEASWRGSTEPDSPDEKSVADRADELIRHRASEPRLSASTIASTLGIHERTLHRSMAALEKTFGETLRRCRCDLACRMLSSRNFDGVTLGQVGRRAGFNDASHFSKVFTSYVGVNPSVYRRARKEEREPRLSMHLSRGL